MLKVWHDEAWAEYLWWQDNDRKGLRRVFWGYDDVPVREKGEVTDADGC